MFSKPKRNRKALDLDALLRDEERKSLNRIARISKKKLEAAVKDGRLVVYTKEDNTTLFVSRTFQEKLDKALAWKIQKLIYDGIFCEKVECKDDAALSPAPVKSMQL